MRRVLSIAAALLSLAAWCREFNAAEQKAEIERLSAEVDKTALYYTEFWDILETQVASLDATYQAAYFEDRNIDAMVNSTLSKMNEKFNATIQKYNAVFTDLQSWESQLNAMSTQLNSMLNSEGLRPHSGEPWQLHVDGYWGLIQNLIPTLPNPFVTAQGDFWSSPCGNDFYNGEYRRECDLDCGCSVEHGRSNIPEVYTIMQNLNKASIRVVQLRQHPPTW